MPPAQSIGKQLRQRGQKLGREGCLLDTRDERETDVPICIQTASFMARICRDGAHAP